MNAGDAITTPVDTASRIGAVVIGRNEGERLKRCLESVVGAVRTVVYVDSGSTDGSVELAESMKVDVVQLETDAPFTAARARNAGVERLLALQPDIEFIQVIDGDCELIDGWLDEATRIMDDQPRVAVACGRRRERDRDATIYNRLCDMEWDTPVGEAASCGGDALIRREAFDQTGGYTEHLIAGEEPEFCLRLRRSGWTVQRIDCDMTWHDARMTTFRQWWRRSVRAGYAYAAGHAEHGGGPERYRVKEIRSILEWALLLPLLAFGLAWWTWGLSVFLFLVYGGLWWRVRRHRLEHGDDRDDAELYARFIVIGKFANLWGVVRFWIDRARGRRSPIIEYKKHAETQHEVGATHS